MGEKIAGNQMTMRQLVAATTFKVAVIRLSDIYDSFNRSYDAQLPEIRQLRAL